jgi:hypothetical protein
MPDEKPIALAMYGCVGNAAAFCPAKPRRKFDDPHPHPWGITHFNDDILTSSFGINDYSHPTIRYECNRVNAYL